MNKYTYYVSLGLMKVHPEPIDSGTNYFEIEATKEQASLLQHLLDDLYAKDHRPGPLAKNPIKESYAEEGRRVQEEGMKEFYTRVYQYGTPKTKEEIESMGIGEDMYLNK
ncbi:hypothetical protein LC040_18875 [Bacillus tianshenii]|nr:hypothetical protein LC040_18875 [Bacillus tianshenii]